MDGTPNGTTGDDFAKLANVRDNALVALGAVYLVAAVVYAWAGRPPPPFSVAVFVALPMLAVGTHDLHRARPGRWSAVLRAVWPAFIAPPLYFAQVRVLEIDRSRYIDSFLLAVDEWLGIREGGHWIWASGGLLEEVANALYLSYYLLPVIVLWLAVRDGPAFGVRATTALSLTTVVCGLVWLALPSGGYYPTGGPVGPGLGPFTALAHGIYTNHPHFAAAFPSEHAAHAACFAYVMRQRGVGPWIWLWGLGIAASTVIGEYHFAADAGIGWLVGIAAASATDWIVRDAAIAPQVTTV